MGHNPPPALLKTQLLKEGYSEKMVEELWKWYDPSGKRGAASF
jgi:hypothetical protein